MIKVIAIPDAISITVIILPELSARSLVSSHCEMTSRHIVHVAELSMDWARSQTGGRYDFVAMWAGRVKYKVFAGRHRLSLALWAVLEMSGFQPKILVEELPLPGVNATIRNLGGCYLLGVTSSLVGACTESQLRAALAHELAHVVLGHRSPWTAVGRVRTTEDEQEADALAVSWCGKSGMCSLLHILIVDAANMRDRSLQQRARAELKARIKALT